MKTINFTNIYIENFGKHSNAVGGKTVANRLGRRTVISGSNACGKSTVKRAIQYVLGTKDENGKEIAGIRPHNKNGIDIDGLTTVTALEVSVDGMENTLQKTYFQKKNRQGEYTGENETQYFIDDIKKATKKAYDEFVSSFLPNMVCISAQELLMKDTAGRRAMLEVFSKHDINSIIDENPNFEPLRAKLKANAVTDLKKACRDKIKIKTKERDAYPTRINEIEKQKVDIDLVELVLHRNALNEQIAEVKEKQTNIDKQFEEYDKLADGIMELKFRLNDLQRKADEENNRKKTELDYKIIDIQIEIEKTSNEVLIHENNIKSEESFLKSYQDSIKQEKENYKNASSIEFNPNELICPMCQREYEQERKQEIRNSFDKNKAETLARITDNGNYFKTAIEQCKRHVEGLKKEKIELQDKIFELRKSLKTLVCELEKSPESIDISDCPEVQEIQRRIAEKERAMNKGNSVKEIREQLQKEYEDLQQQLNEVEFKFLEAKKNDEIDTNIEKLKKEQRAKSQEIADIEKEIDLLKQFERKKAELLESDINSNFNIIQWHMFKKIQNGDLADICSPFVNGTSYDGNLNKGARILAQLDICLSFQKLYDVQMPILLDDGESIDSWRIPNIENQIIMFKRDDNPKLTIKVME